MKSTTEISDNERARIGALRAMQILDTPPEERFDRITRITARLFNVPIALVSLVDAERQWFKSRCGLDISGTSREVSFCAYAIQGDETFVVENALTDQRFRHNPLVIGDPKIRFYAGHPLRSTDGFKVGTLCIIDRRSRQFAGHERQMLKDLAAIVEQEFHLLRYFVLESELLKARGIAEESLVELRHNEEQLKKLSKAVEKTADSVVLTNKQGVIEYVNPSFEKTTGYTRKEALGQTPRMLKSGMHDRSFYKKLWRKVLSGNSYRGTIINRKKGGNLYWSEQTITPLKDEDGNVTNFVTVMKDITELREKHEQDTRLRIAREIQQRLFVPEISVPGYDIAGATYPVVETSGDYFDFVPLADGCIGIVLGDALGHGIGAALMMVQTRAYLRAFARTESDPGVILNLLNQELSGDLANDHFVTLILARLDPRQNILDYASAGHVPAYLLDSLGRVGQVMESTGVPLGIKRDWTYHKSEPIQLAPENVLVFFSDGLIELLLRGKIELWVDRALDIITHHRLASSHQILENLYQEVRHLSKGQPQADDMTCIVCKVLSSRVT